MVAVKTEAEALGYSIARGVLAFSVSCMLLRRRRGLANRADR